MIIHSFHPHPLCRPETYLSFFSRAIYVLKCPIYSCPSLWFAQSTKYWQQRSSTPRGIPSARSWIQIRFQRGDNRFRHIPRVGREIVLLRRKMSFCNELCRETMVENEDVLSAYLNCFSSDFFPCCLDLVWDHNWMTYTPREINESPDLHMQKLC